MMKFVCGAIFGVCVLLFARVDEVCALNAAPLEGIGNQHAVRYEDLENAALGYESFDISRDEQRIAYTRKGKVYVKLLGKNRESVEIAEGFAPKWSPDGARLAFYSTIEKQVQLLVYNYQKRTITTKTELPGGVNPDPLTGLLAWSLDGAFRFDWSPDGTRIVFASRVAPGSVSRDENNLNRDVPIVLSRTTPSDLTLAGIFRQGAGVAQSNGSDTSRNGDLSKSGTDQLFVIDLRKQNVETRQLTANSEGCFHPTWSPSGSSIACVTTYGKPIDGSLTITDILDIDATSASVRGKTSGNGLKCFPSWSPNGERIVFYKSDRDGVYGAPTLYAWYLSKDLMYPLLPGSDYRIQAYQINPVTGDVLYLFRDGLRSSLGRVSLIGGRAPIELRSDSIDRLPVSIGFTKTGKLAWTSVTSANPGIIELMSTPGKNPKTIVDLNPEAANWKLGKRYVLTWTNRRGEKLEGIVIEPANRNGKPLPAIVDAYPLSRGLGWTLLAGNRAWASEGYLVFIPAPRGPHAWMNDWSTRTYSLMARGSEGWEVAYDDLTSGVDALISQGSADSSRVCLYGHSNGAAVALNVIARTSRFNCAVAIAPAMLDWLQIATLRTGTAGWATRVFGSGSVYDDPQSYLALSVVYRASRIHTPTLLALGDADDVEIVLPTISMYNSLRYLDRDVTLVRYPDQGHSISGVALQDLWRRELAFFDLFLSSTANCSQLGGECQDRGQASAF
jgi:dipeptidyl aminopeptidase/acylaminoacyl peptidase